MNKIKNIIILAGGKSNRFWPLGDKNTIFVGNHSLIQKQVLEYTKYSDRVIVVVNPDTISKIRRQIESIGLQKKVEIISQRQHGQAEAVLEAGKLGIKGETLIANSNDIVEVESLIKEIKKKNIFDLVITSFETKEYFPGGYLEIKGDRVINIIEKPDLSKVPSNYVKIDFNLFRSIEDFILILKDTKSEKDDVFEVAQSKFSKKYKTGFIIYRGQWLTMKYPWHLFNFMYKELKRKKTFIGKNSSISPKAIINGNVYIGNNVTVYEYAKINGNCYIGDNSIIGNYSMITDSHIGKNSLIGSYTEVTRSYLGESISLHRNYIGDSILMDNCFFGAGVTCANMRLDKKTIRVDVKGMLIDTKLQKLGTIAGAGVKVGINSSIMPGVKLESNSIIMPNQLITKDIKNN